MNQIAIMESKIEVLCKQVDDLKKDLALNASMLARQCDLAREAETQALRLRFAGIADTTHREAIAGQNMNTAQVIIATFGNRTG